VNAPLECVRDLQIPKVAPILLLPNGYHQPSMKPLPPIISGHDLLHQELVLPDELVEGMIHRGTQTLVAGCSKSYKTWILMHLAVCVATGTDFWDRKTVQGRILYLNFEIGAAFFQKRLREICRLAAGDDKTINSFDVWNLRGHCADISALAPAIIERCRGEGYALIIPDPIYKILGGRNENAAGEIAEFLNHLDAMCVETGAAIVFGHHFAKGSASGKEQIDRASGSGVFSRHPDGIITLTKHQEELAYVVEATLRNLPPMKPFGVRWEYPLMLPDTGIDTKKLKQAGRPTKHQVSEIVSVLVAGMTKAKWMEKAGIARGVSRSTFYELAKLAEEKGDVVVRPDGSYAQTIIENPSEQ
jgi:hypothetical protein